MHRAPRLRPAWPPSLLLHVAFLLVLAVATAVALGYVLWFSLGKPDLEAPPPAPAVTPVPLPSQTPSGVGGGSAGRPLTVAERLDAIKLVLAVVGGVGAIVALTVAYRRQKGGELAEHREDTRIFTERFVRAADQLGSESAAVRVAGVHALGQLADDWLQGRQQCIDVLCAYLRLPYETDVSADGYKPGEREVRRTLIRLIRNHLRGEPWSAVSWTGYRFSFEGAVFDCGDLSKARLAGGNVTFHGARFVADTFQFDGVQFLGAPVWFTGAQFAGATVTFDGACFGGSRVDFDGAVVSSGKLLFRDARHESGEVRLDKLTHTGGELDLGPFRPAGSTSRS